MTNKHLVLLGFLFGALTLVFSLGSGLDYLRWFVGLSFIYLFSGYPLSLLILPKANSFAERLLASSGLGLLLTYPAGFLNVLWEGQSGTAIFGYHLTGDILSLLGLYILSVFILIIKKKPSSTKTEPWLGLHWLLCIPVVLSVFLNFSQLGRPDLNGDEYDLGYQAYNLVDGIFAGRKAYVLSFSAHPPLAMYIQHYTMNALSPSGLDSLSDGMFRVGPAIVGVLVVALVYLLAFETTGSAKIAFLSALLLSVNNYHVFLSRIFHREMFLNFFLVLSFYFLVKHLKTNKISFLQLASLFLGTSILVKEVAIIFLPIFLLKVKRQLVLIIIVLLLFSPVLLYNLGAYLTTGYTDVFFSRIFQTPTHPGGRLVDQNVMENVIKIVHILADQYGIAFLPFLVFFFVSLFKLKKNYRWLMVTAVVIILYAFTLNGVRPYYLSFITIPLIILFVDTSLSLRNFLSLPLYVVLVLYSVVYTANTYFQHSFAVGAQYTDSIPDFHFNTPYSFNSRGWLEDRGWKKTLGEVAKIYDTTDCLSFSDNLSSLLVRRYFLVGDKIKEYYLGKNYPRRFLACGESFSGDRIKIFLDSDQKVSYKIV